MFFRKQCRARGTILARPGPWLLCFKVVVLVVARTSFGAQVEEIQSYRAFFKGAQWHRLVRVLSRVTYHDMATAGTEAAAVALWALATNWSRPKQAVCLAATFGGSAPATALLAGALAGALHGREWIPSTWWEGLEDAPGVADPAAGVRGDAVALAQQLAQLGCAQVGMPAPAQQ